MTTPSVPIQAAAGDELTVEQFHDVLRLRIDVFVVEQTCPYPELDGHDLAATTKHFWVDDEQGPISYLRTFAEAGETRIGRVATRSDQRGHGWAGRLLAHVLAAEPGPFGLHAQTYLTDWYRGFGFEVVGDEFLEDGIPHIMMVRGSAA